MPIEFDKSETMVNLMRAFAGESQARNRYTFAADKAKNMGFPFIETAFKLTASQEKEHAEIFWNHLKQVSGSNIEICGAYPVEVYNDLPEILSAARHNEFEEYEHVYPEFARIAKDEGFSDIAYSFEKIAQIEKTHGERFACFKELLESSRLFTGEDETEWICLNCGHIYVGGSVPPSCPVCHHEKGYFVPYKYYKFIAQEYGRAVL